MGVLRQTEQKKKRSEIHNASLVSSQEALKQSANSTKSHEEEK